MTQPAFIPSDRRIVDTVIGLASIAKSHRVILAGSNSFEMQRRGSAMFLAVSTTWHSSPGPGPRSGFSKQRPTGLYIFSALRASRDLGRSSSNVQSSTQAGAEKARLSYRIRNPLRRRCGHICSTNQFDRSRVSREAMTMHIIGRHVSEPSYYVLPCRVGEIAKAQRPALGA